MSETTFGRPIIHVIEDNPQDLRLLSNLVKDQGQIIFSTSGRDGLRLSTNRLPDLILLDMELPDINGYDVCRELKLSPETSAIPVIFVTSHNSSQHEVAALEAGAVDFITKPFNPPVICARVKTHLTLSRQSKQLHNLADRDGLTDVFNRRYFDEHAEAEWKRHLRQEHPLAVMLLDVDRFKQFNDIFGHIAGDECLKALARIFKQCTRRPGEFVARYGGEEFVFLLPHTQLNEAKRFGEHVCAAVQALKIPHPQTSGEQFVTASLGAAAVIPLRDMRLLELVSRADQALYLAKSSGRNRCHGYSPSDSGHSHNDRSDNSHFDENHSDNHGDTSSTP